MFFVTIHMVVMLNNFIKINAIIVKMNQGVCIFSGKTL